MALLRRNDKNKTWCRPGEQRTRTGWRARPEGGVPGQQQGSSTTDAVHGLPRSASRTAIGKFEFRFKKYRNIGTHASLLPTHRKDTGRQTTQKPGPARALPTSGLGRYVAIFVHERSPFEFPVPPGSPGVVDNLGRNVGRPAHGASKPSKKATPRGISTAVKNAVICRRKTIIPPPSKSARVRGGGVLS